MNSYLLRRLAPFFVFSVLVEFGFMALQLYQNAANVDFSFLTMVKTGGVLLLTTSVSFLFVMQPYVFYLLVLPRRRQNGRLLSALCTEPAAAGGHNRFAAAHVALHHSRHRAVFAHIRRDLMDHTALGVRRRKR